MQGSLRSCTLPSAQSWGSGRLAWGTGLHGHWADYSALLIRDRVHRRYIEMHASNGIFFSSTYVYATYSCALGFSSGASAYAPAEHQRGCLGAVCILKCCAYCAAQRHEGEINQSQSGVHLTGRPIRSGKAVKASTSPG